MIELMNLKTCRDNLVKYNVSSDLFHLIVDNKEVYFLKFGDFVLVNKFISNKNIDKFDEDERLIYYNKKPNDYDDDMRKIYGLFCCDRVYLNYVSSGTNYSLNKESFSKVDWHIVRNLEDLLDYKFDYSKESVMECNRDDLRVIFDYNNYDSMYVLNDTGNFLFVGNKVDGVIIDDEIVPSDEKIIKLDLMKRKISAIGYDENITSRNIDEIDDVYIYGDNRYRHLIITSKDGCFNVNWFNLKYVGNDKYVLKVYNVFTEELSMDKSSAMCKVREK